MPWDVRFNRGIHLPQIGCWLDAGRSQARSFVSHAHSDHIAGHREIIATRATASLMRLRLEGRRRETILEFEQRSPVEFGCEVTLYPAGHIFGSAMFHAATEHGTLLYTGDFKLRPSAAAETCVVPRADVLVMETTFGLPRYVFPPADEIERAILEFCRTALAENVTPVFFAYSLGKTQELLQIVGRAGIPVMLHKDGYRMTRRYQELGMSLPPFRLLDVRERAGHAVICPPMSGGDDPVSWIHPRRTAMVSGWALDKGAIYRFGCDAAFPLSDHADFPDLLAFVERVQPKVVYTLHGFAREFAATLRARGVEAWAIGQGNQLELGV
ncbi:MAG TPA: MBL fold metallo-hydrolase RNA specificity domain-containing protein [Lacunisphaera sp.]|jgi:Cft2 family RNA processing exonuclease|nr:MBL fold metallo-hydrolase RNA specificity domain-containing protein [Lacunisphaera sp.]